MASPNWSFYLLLFYCYATLQAISRTCPPDPQKHKILRVGVFYTDKMYRFWVNEFNARDGLNPYFAINNLVREVNRWFTPEKLGFGNQVTVKVNPTNVFRISDAEFEKKILVPERLFQSAEKLCTYANNLMRNNRMEWDVSFLFHDANARNEFRGVHGVTANMETACSPFFNGGIVLSTRTHASTFGIYPKLWVHEIGHVFGLMEKRDCVKRNYSDCIIPGGRTIMGSPGSHNSEWSKFSKRRINDRFRDEKQFTCLKWQCGQYTPNDMLTNPVEKKMLNDICNNVRRGFEVPGRFTELELVEMFPSQNRYRAMILKNPEYYKQEHVCKGVPCRQIKSDEECKLGCLRSTFRLAQAYLTKNNVQCGVNKSCIDGGCFSKT